MSSPNPPTPNDTPQVLLEHHLKLLRLPTFLREYDKVARRRPIHQKNPKTSDPNRFLSTAVLRVYVASATQ